MDALAATLEQLETARQRVIQEQNSLWRQYRLWLVVALSCFTAGFLIKADAAILFYVLGVFIALIGLLITSTVSAERADSINRQYKQTVLPLIAHELDPSLTYQIDGALPEADFSASGLFESVDAYFGKDYFSGKIGKTDVRFALAHAQEEYETTATGLDEKGKPFRYKTTELRSLFVGLAFSGDFNKHFSGTTQVWSRDAAHPETLPEGNVELESPQFNACFNVRSSDQVSARYLLTPVMMEHLLELRAQFGAIHVAFANDRILVLIPGELDVFDADTEKPMNMHITERPRTALTRVLGLVEMLDLNTRIWTKT